MNPDPNKPPLPPPPVPEYTPAQQEQGRREIVEMLIQGLRVEDEQLNQICLRAMQLFVHTEVEYLESYSRTAPMTSSQRLHLQSVIDEYRTGPPTTRDARHDVIHAMLDALRVDDPTLNELATQVAARFPPVVVDRLLEEYRRTNVTPDHCQRLLTAVERNGGTLNWEGAGGLLQLMQPPGLDSLSLQADRIYWNQFVHRPDRTFGGG